MRFPGLAAWLCRISIWELVLFMPLLSGRITATDSKSYKLVCYYTNWSQFRDSPATFTVDDVDPSLCTHLIYAYAAIDRFNLATTATNDNDTYTRFNELKSRNPALLTLLSVGGSSEGGLANFRRVADTAETRRTFVSNVIAYLRFFDFDGLDIAWEYPTTDDTQPHAELVMELRRQFEEEAAETGSPSLLLACVLGHSADVYNLEVLARELDFANLKAFGFAGTDYNYTTIHSALRHSTNPSQHKIVSEYNSMGFPVEKLVLGLPTYGRSYLLNLAFIAPPPSTKAKGAGMEGPFTQKKGTIANFEICKLTSNGGWTLVMDEEYQASYWFLLVNWISFDNVWSAQKKAEYVKLESLGGIMIWDLSGDDFSGYFCKNGSYPLVDAVRKSLIPSEAATTTSVETTTTSTHKRDTTSMYNAFRTTTSGSIPVMACHLKVIHLVLLIFCLLNRYT